MPTPAGAAAHGRDKVDRWLLVLALLALAAGTTWLLDELDVGPQGPQLRQSHEPDYYLERFTELAMDAEGAPLRRLSAEFMVHYPDDDSSELVSPRLELYNAGSAPWHVIAERGWVGADGEVVLLYGAVEIWRDAADGHREIEVHTRDLRVLPDERYAESDNPTTIRNRTTVTHAVGMRADFQARRLELLSRVRSRHDVQTDS